MGGKAKLLEKKGVQKMGERERCMEREEVWQKEKVRSGGVRVATEQMRV